MTRQNSQRNSDTFLRAGDCVQVRSFPEILATLDSNGQLDKLPFMPEMIQFCGKKFRVSKRAENSCFENKVRRMGNAVHLMDLRCDGSSHDGCQIRCLLFWREEWLNRISSLSQDTETLSSISYPSNDSATDGRLRTRSGLHEGSVTYICQATEIGKIAKEEIKLWNLSSYVREFRVGNAGWLEAKWLVRWFLAWIRWRIFKFFSSATTTPVVERQNISLNDLVEIRPQKEILASLTKSGKNHGLAFSAEMLTFCGKQYRVLDKIDRMIDEETGKMKELKNACLILESVTCRGNCTLCPRAKFHFWRNEWLKAKTSL